MSNLTDELADLNINARELIEKIDGFYNRLDTKTQSSLDSIQALLDGGHVATTDNALKLEGKSLEEVVALSSETKLYMGELQPMLSSVTYHQITPTNEIDVTEYTTTNTTVVRLAVYYLHGGSSDHSYWDFYTRQKGDTLNKTGYKSRKYNNYYNSEFTYIDVPIEKNSESKIIEIITTSSYNDNSANKYVVYYAGRIDNE